MPRANSTPVVDLHPGDHNAIVADINAADDALAAWIAAHPYKIYDSVAERDAASTVGVAEGTLAWAISERTLAVWRDSWLILREPYRPWDPVVYIGTEAVPVSTPPARESGYRYDFGLVQFNLSVRIGPLRPTYPPADPMSVTPPIAPNGSGLAGPGYAVSSSVAVGAIGTGCLYDPDRLAILKPPTGLAAFWDFQGELTPPAPDDPPDPTKGIVETVDIYMSGYYLTTAFGP